MDLPDASFGQGFALDALLCPACGGDYLHHEGLAYFDREEDAATGNLTILGHLSENDELVYSASTQTKACMNLCPSPRRDGLTIGFWCELCAAKPSLSIYQHKGQTYAEWTAWGLPKQDQIEAPSDCKSKDLGAWTIENKELVLTSNESRCIDFERCNSSAQILDWIFHYRGRLSQQEMADLLRAFELILNPRRNYCSFGQDKRADGLDLLNQWLNPKPQRKPIKPSVRFEVLKRDGYRCQMCGATAKDGATLEIDHIHPVSKGGSNEPSNLQVLCRDCNAGKRDHPL
ncbi:hypothetical protein [Synechococcus phage S-H1]|nr:hypothetical protein [Synechococcus phage S-H1]